jgi:hypothetical protein
MNGNLTKEIEKILENHVSIIPLFGVSTKEFYNVIDEIIKFINKK